MGEEHSPNFIGVGAMKSATTWISECLRYHPEVFVSDIKELHFFSKNWSKGKEWYFSHFKAVESQKAVGEFSVSYMDDPIYARRILELLGPVKIIISLRNPIERFISHYKHNCRVEETAKTFNSNYIDELTFQNAVKIFPDLLSKGLYSSSILKFYELFGKENVLVLFKDDIDSNPHQVVQNLYEFLNISKEFAPPIINKTVSVGIVPKVKSLESFRVFLYKKLKSNYPKAIVFIRKFRLAEMYRRLNKSKQSFKLAPAIHKELTRQYEEDIRNLERLFNRNLNNWKFIENKQ